VTHPLARIALFFALTTLWALLILKALYG